MMFSAFLAAARGAASILKRISLCQVKSDIAGKKIILNGDNESVFGREGKDILSTPQCRRPIKFLTLIGCPFYLGINIG
jgi:hypothetical protein